MEENKAGIHFLLQDGDKDLEEMTGHCPSDNRFRVTVHPRTRRPAAVGVAASRRASFAFALLPE